MAETLQLVKEEWWDQLFELIEFIQEHFPSDAAEADFDWDPDNFEEDIGVSIFDEYSRYRPLLADVHGYMTNLLARFGRSNDEMLEDEYGDTFILSEVPYLDFYMDRDINSLLRLEFYRLCECWRTMQLRYPLLRPVWLLPSLAKWEVLSIQPSRLLLMPPRI